MTLSLTTAGFHATGGNTVTRDGLYAVHKFLGSSSFVCTGSATGSALVVGGGGGGAGGNAGNSGGVRKTDWQLLDTVRTLLAGDGTSAVAGALGVSLT